MKGYIQAVSTLLKTRGQVDALRGEVRWPVHGGCVWLSQGYLQFAHTQYGGTTWALRDMLAAGLAGPVPRTNTTNHVYVPVGCDRAYQESELERAIRVWEESRHVSP